MKKLLPKRLLFLLPGLLAFGVTLYAQAHPDWTELVYSQAVYPVLSSIIGFVPSLMPFSVAQWWVVLFLLLCLWYVVYYVRKLMKGRGAINSHICADGPRLTGGSNQAFGGINVDDSSVGAEEAPLVDGSHPCETSLDAGAGAARACGRGILVYRGIVGVLAIVSMLYFAFTILCGLNYYRYTFASFTGYELQQSQVGELEQLCVSLAEGMNETRAQVGEGAEVIAADALAFERYSQQSVAAMRALAEQYPVLQRPLYSEPKPVLVSELMSASGIMGIFFPFTVESNINKDIPLFTLPSTMAHELVHQCGFMREDEANFIAYLACVQSGDPLMRYSGYYLAFTHATSALRSADPEAVTAVMSGLSATVREDMVANNRFWG